MWKYTSCSSHKGIRVSSARICMGLLTKCKMKLDNLKLIKRWGKIPFDHNKSSLSVYWADDTKKYLAC